MRFIAAIIVFTSHLYFITTDIELKRRPPLLVGIF